MSTGPDRGSGVEGPDLEVWPLFSTQQFLSFLPLAPQPDVWVSAFQGARPRSGPLERFGITTADRLAAFLAQVAHESAGFTRLEENLNYSAKRLTAVWPRRFPTLESAHPYEHQPERLANLVYARRLGNGDADSGDGWRYRGRGLIQLTGRGNYRLCGQALALPLEAEPDQLLQPQIAALAAAQFWHSRGLNELADDRSGDDDDEDFTRISILINGGREGLESRRSYWAKAKSALSQEYV
jgi:putative chitinase